ncbi:sulfatase [Flagellimonas eckloniae]|uniref:Iduronate-2-sulfatase n=1 Tax=Flagellimonas eckloniae TaxID=346185 RepID=A0A0Q0XNV8_9FLAO|nr:sulfatase [Allomuricauda eckloniae]KQC30738.1 iduronate-2-sulfatase [Allomuricauda eckloniae]
MNLKQCIVLLGFSVLYWAASCQEIVDQPKNILLICIDDLRPELNSFGANYIKSPHIDGLAAMGRPFSHHYVNAPSCGPSRYTLLTGLYGTANNDAIFLRAKQMEKSAKNVPPSMPEWFRQNGYTTVSVGKVSHHPGGRGGTNWDSDSIPEMPNAWNRHLMPVGSWKTPKGAMHGLANGNIREVASEHDVLEAEEGPDEIYPDGLIVSEGLTQLEKLATGTKPFFLAIGLIKPHLPFGAPKKYLDLYNDIEFPPISHPEKPQGKTTWHESGEFMKYNRWGKDPREDQQFAMELRRHYAACVSYADKQVGDILNKLKETGADKNTIVVLWGDHGWHLGEHSIWGKHSLFEESLRSPLIIYDPEMNNEGVKSNAVVETLDIFPTLCDLTGLKIPGFTQGTSLAPILEYPQSPGHIAIAYTSSARTIRTEKYRFIQHENGEVELYDHSTKEKETQNIASTNVDLVVELRKRLVERRGN